MRKRKNALWRRIDRGCDWIAMLLLLIVCFSLPSSCDTKNVNTFAGTSFPIVTVYEPLEMHGNEEATWVITWLESTGPYSIDIDMGGGAVPNNLHIGEDTRLSTYLTQADDSAADDQPAG